MGGVMRPRSAAGLDQSFLSLRAIAPSREKILFTQRRDGAKMERSA